MFNILRESLRITNGNIIIATPLIFFSIISSLYLLFSSSGNNTSLFFSAILFLLMLGAFISGWFYMITKAVKDSDIEDNKLIQEFPAGVGEYFLSIMGMLLQIFIISSIIIFTVILAGKKIIGPVGISYTQFTGALADVNTMKAFVNQLSHEQLVKINLWNILFFCTMIINYFIVMLYPAAIFFKTKNPFKAFFITLKDTFGHRFLKNICVFFITVVLYMILSSLTVLSGNNIFIHFVLTLLNFYYLTFISILIFNYYYCNFIKIGSNIDTTV